MFSETVQLYDVVYSGKDYASEARHVHDVLLTSGVVDGGDLLDVACGTGRHLQHFRAWYDVDGLDINGELIDIARERLPDVRFHVEDMRTFDLGRQFSVVTCLFGSVAYARTLDGLEQAVRTMAGHVATGGALAIEPFVFAENYEVGRPTALLVEQADLKLARLHVADAADEGRTAVFDFFYMVAVRGGRVQQVRERHELGLFSQAEYRRALLAAGLRVDFDARGPMGRGLFIGRKD